MVGGAEVQLGGFCGLMALNDLAYRRRGPHNKFLYVATFFLRRLRPLQRLMRRHLRNELSLGQITSVTRADEEHSRKPGVGGLPLDHAWQERFILTFR